MIPKIIHYCWFGENPLPISALRCIESWKKYLPNYEIKEWNETNFDVNLIRYTNEAYAARKYAFVSDYARFWILYHCGGVYFDTDVELIKDMTPIINKGAFMGMEDTGQNSHIVNVAPGLGIASPAFHPVYKQLLDLYDSLYFINDDGELNLKTVVAYTTEILQKKGLTNKLEIQCIEDIMIYPTAYFSPKNFYTGKIKITPNTYSIHHYSMSWLPAKTIYLSKIKRFLMRIFGNKNIERIIHVLRLKR